jgi:hypothetical protein
LKVKQAKRKFPCNVAVCLAKVSVNLKQADCAHAAGDAQGDGGMFRAAPPAPDQHMTCQVRAWHAKVMANGNGATVDVEPNGRIAFPFLTKDGLISEGFVEISNPRMSALVMKLRSAPTISTAATTVAALVATVVLTRPRLTSTSNALMGIWPTGINKTLLQCSVFATSERASGVMQEISPCLYLS